MRHFYHLYCGPGANWRQVAGEHVGVLQATGASWEVTAGVVGPPETRAAVRAWLTANLPVVDFIEADTGWEQVTLRGLHAWAKVAPPEEPVLYAHSKGVLHYGTDKEQLETVWRWSMTRNLVAGWQRCVELLGQSDLVGCHWFTPEDNPIVEAPMFGGNFWWGRAGYLASLPPLEDLSRFHAEGWVGSQQPRVSNLQPGWPTLGLFRVDVDRLRAERGDKSAEQRMLLRSLGLLM